MHRRNRLDKTLADYVAIAIGPALIMVLIGSLVFFLLTVFYQGQFQGRLHFIMCCFIMATVLIGRISIEEGTEHAVMYAIPLALVTVLAMGRFVEVRGAMAAFSPFINIGMLALIWWCAHKLTWDCTLVDETENASGQGLLQNIGMDDTPAEAELPESQPTTPAEEVEDRYLQELAEKSWWSRLVDKRHTPHPPGLWVVYFSLAAMPLFGLGQWFLPTEPASVRSYSFLLLACYVGSALALLLSTSFLGLRRYLRQRNMEMPGNMAFGWIGTGGLMILVLLLVCSILPRPGSFGSDKPPIEFGSPEDVQSNSWSLGEEGVEEEGGDPYESEDQPNETGPGGNSVDGNEPAGNQIDKNAKQTRGGKSGEPGSKGDKAKSGKASPKGQGKKGGKGKAAGGKSKNGKSNDKGKSAKGGGSSKSGKSGGKNKSSEQKSSKSSKGGKGKAGNDSGQGKSKGKQEDGQKGNGGKSDGGNADGKKEGGKSDGKEKGKNDPSSSKGENGLNFNDKSGSPNPADSDNRASGSNRKSKSDKSGRNKKDRKSSNRKMRPQKSKSRSRRTSKMSMGWLHTVGTVLRWVIIGVVVAIIVFLAWKHWAALVAAWKKLLEDIRNWFGGKRPQSQEPATAASMAVVANDRPFAAFQDPFDSGLAERLPPADVVRYTFQAVEAWAREKGLPRKDEQTAHEFANQIGEFNGDLATSTKTLAQLYSQAAYAEESLPKTAARHLKQLWRDLYQV